MATVIRLRGLQIQPRALPHIAPRLAGDVILNRLGKRCGIGKGSGDEVFAHHRFAGSEALFIRCGHGNSGYVHENGKDNGFKATPH